LANFDSLQSFRDKTARIDEKYLMEPIPEQNESFNLSFDLRKGTEKKG
jgi:hypothetical protein